MNRHEELQKAWTTWNDGGDNSDDTRYEVGFEVGFISAWDALLAEIRPLVNALVTEREILLKVGHVKAQQAKFDHTAAIKRLRELVREVDARPKELGSTEERP